MIPVQITTHVADGLRRLMTQYKGKATIEGILTVYLQRWQELEDMAYDFFELLDIDTAVGAQLDLIGEIVGEERHTLDDDRYRKFIYLRIFRQRKLGTIPNTTELYKRLTGADRVRYTPLYPAGASYYAHNPDGVLSGAELRSIMLTMIPAGVELELTAGTEPGAFAFEGDDTGGGFGDANDPATGGGLAGLQE